MADQSTGPKRIDPFFETVLDGEWNACVGRQGDALNYVDGYLEAARELVAAVIDKRLYASRDTLAMPILYNCRHAVELSLKFVIDDLYRMGLIAVSHPVNHDVLSHWYFLRDARVGDINLGRLISELQPFIVSLAAIDEDGQELRYPTNRTGATSLGSIAVVNLPLIRRSIDELSAILGHLKARLSDLKDELLTCTHTKECSRADLEEIARMLGDYASWRSPDFKVRKQHVMKHFGLSGRKFSDAVNAIRKSRPLAAMIGLESEIYHLDDQKAVTVLELWAQAHPEREYDAADPEIVYSSRDWSEIDEEWQAVRDLDKDIFDLLTLEEFSDLEVLFYIGRDRVMGEHYEMLLQRTIAKYQSAASLWEGVHHIMWKTNLLDAAVKGAGAVGRPSLAAKLRAIRPI